MYGREATGPLDLIYSKWSDEGDSEEVPINEFVRQLCDTVSVALAEGQQTQEEQAEGRIGSYNLRHKAKLVKFKAGDPYSFTYP
jgi:hypothetical protein